MDTIVIPSPTSFLAANTPTPPKSPSLPPPPAAAAKRSANAAAKKKKKTTTTTTTTTNTTVKKTDASNKPKQSKSRNGCITCKAKRLKCDEVKPSCQQCHKRSVECGGYKKDFKWRPFEEATFVNKIAPLRPKKPEIRRRENRDGLPREKSPASRPSAEKTPKVELVHSPSNSDGSSDPGPDGGDSAVQDQFYSPLQSPALSHVHSNSFSDHVFQPSMGFGANLSPLMRDAGMSMFHANLVTSSLDSLFSEPEVPQSRSGQSPRLIDLLLPGSELNAPRPVGVEQPPIDQNDQFEYIPDMMHDPILDEDIEEIIRQPPMISSHDMWMMARDPMYSVFARSPTPPPCAMFADPLYKFYRQPELRTNSSEMLMLRFDRQTCGILSVKDGPTENPWRTLIWPLARDSPALYHAIASMTAFHTSKENPALRVDGMEHMRRSIRALATGIEKMSTDTALATTLALAFSESWDVHISTGIEHLRGARILVNQALARFSAVPVYGDDLARLRFLCNTWVYMDVIARLTSDSDSTEDTDFTGLLAPLYPSSADSGNETNPSASDVDPLMGCACTLFPLLGRVATLVRTVRSTPTNSIPLISSSLSLQDSLLLWTPPPLFAPPEDPTSDIQHGLQTAEAYRYATLLFLHQAVPEIPSLSSAKLAKKTLVYLATVPITSRLVIVQIFPLLAAGCEVVEEADRAWVRERWAEMERRMMIGNLDKCRVVTEEVWRRRDAYEAAMARREAAKLARKAVVASAKTRFEAEMATLDEVLGAAGERAGRAAAAGKRAVRAARAGDLAAMPEGALGGLKRRHGAHGSADGAATATASKRRRKSADEGIGEVELEFTVRGCLHWLEVMKEWDWEVLLG